MTLPSLATAPATIAICRGVVRTSYWPMPVSAVFGSLAPFG